jgi:hypothetical protein
MLSKLLRTLLIISTERKRGNLANNGSPYSGRAFRATGVVLNNTKIARRFFTWALDAISCYFKRRSTMKDILPEKAKMNWLLLGGQEDGF